MSDQSRTFPSSGASGEIPFGADDLEALDRGERRRRRVEHLRVDQGAGAVLGLVESLADSDWRVRRAAAQALAGETEVDASSLLGDLLYSDDAGERNAAIKALIKRSGESISVLLKHARSSVPDVRNFSVLALGQIGDPQVLDVLLPMLDAEPDENVRQMLIESLGRIGDPRAVGALVRVLEEDTFASVAAAEALGSIGSLQALGPLRRHLGDTPVGAACAEALGRLSDMRAIPPLAQSLVGSTETYGVCVVRALAAIIRSAERLHGDILRGFCDRLSAAEKASASRAVIACLSREGADGKAGIAVAAWLCDPELGPYVLQAAHAPELAVDAEEFVVRDLARTREHLVVASRSPSPSIRSVVARSLGRSGDAQDIELVGTLVYDENVSVRIDAIQAFVSLSGREGAPVLCGLLGDEFEEVRIAAAEALATLGSSAWLAALLAELAEGGDERTREVVARVLATVCVVGGCDEMTDLALALARDASVGVRRHAAAALGSLGGHEALSTLLTLALDNDRLLRTAAVRSLAARTEATARQALRRAAADESTSIVAAALNGLSRDASPQDIEMIRSFVTSDDIGVAVAAVTALGCCGTAEDARVVTSVLDHDVPDVRGAALRALATLECALARGAASQAIEEPDPSWQVRLAAVEVLGVCGTAADAGALTRALADGERLVRVAAVECIPRVHRRHAPEHLTALLSDETVAKQVAACLVGIGESAVPTVVRMVEAADQPTQIRACAVLGQVGGEQAEAALLRFVGDVDPALRWAATLGFAGGALSQRAAARMREIAMLEVDPAIKVALETLIGSSPEKVGLDE